MDFTYPEQPAQGYSYANLSYGDSGYAPPPMQRTVSENTDHSTGSNDTYRSAGGYQSPLASVSTFDYSLPGYVASYDNDNQEADYFASIGSQYQDVQEPEPFYASSPTSVRLLESREGDEAAAWDATSRAQKLLSQMSYQRPSFSWIRWEHVDRELGDLRQRDPAVAEWKAVEAVLQRCLFRYLSRRRDTPRDQGGITYALQEAACQIQMRVQGEEVSEICYLVIASVLTKLREGSYRAQETGGPSSSSSSSGAQSTSCQRYVCKVPDCKQGAFGRAADLDRHNKMVHWPDEKKAKFFCDYRRCNRHDSPFFRQDHFRDHLRDFHKEDLLRRGTKAEEKWWKDRSSHALFSGWWRCNRCLVTRVHMETDGWVCPKCNMHCETERQKRRMSGQR